MPSIIEECRYKRIFRFFRDFRGGAFDVECFKLSFAGFLSSDRVFLSVSGLLPGLRAVLARTSPADLFAVLAIL